MYVGTSKGSFHTSVPPQAPLAPCISQSSVRSRPTLLNLFTHGSTICALKKHWSSPLHSKARKDGLGMVGLQRACDQSRGSHAGRQTLRQWQGMFN